MQPQGLPHDAPDGRRGLPTLRRDDRIRPTLFHRPAEYARRARRFAGEWTGARPCGLPRGLLRSRATQLVAKNPAAVSLGRAGGKARVAAMTKAERSESAKKAAAARWKDHTPSTKQDAKRKGKE